MWRHGKRRKAAGDPQRRLRTSGIPPARLPHSCMIFSPFALESPPHEASFSPPALPGGVELELKKGEGAGIVGRYRNHREPERTSK